MGGNPDHLHAASQYHPGIAAPPGVTPRQNLFAPVRSFISFRNGAIARSNIYCDIVDLIAATLEVAAL
jgi:hypothetical protein